MPGNGYYANSETAVHSKNSSPSAFSDISSSEQPLTNFQVLLNKYNIIIIWLNLYK